MKKLPLVLFKPDADALPDSVLVWSGNDLILSESVTVASISTLLQQCFNIEYKIVLQSSTLQLRLNQVASTLEELKVWYKYNVSIVDEIIEQASQVVTQTKNCENDISILEGLANHIDYSIPSFQHLQDYANIVQGSSKYGVNKVGDRIEVFREYQSQPTFSSNELVECTVYPNCVKFDYYPFKNFNPTADNHLYLEKYEGYYTLNLDHFIKSSPTVYSNYAQGTFSISPNPNVLTSVSSDLKVLHHDFGYTVGLSWKWMYAATFTFVAGFGISISGFSIALDPKIFTVLNSGTGIKVSFTDSVYTVEVDYATAGLTPPFDLTADAPLQVAKSGNIFVVSINDGSISSAIEAAATQICYTIENLHYELAHLNIRNLSPSMCDNLLCPLSRLLQYFDNNALSSTASPLIATSSLAVQSTVRFDAALNGYWLEGMPFNFLQLTDDRFYATTRKGNTVFNLAEEWTIVHGVVQEGYGRASILDAFGTLQVETQNSVTLYSVENSQFVQQYKVPSQQLPRNVTLPFPVVEGCPAFECNTFVLLEQYLKEYLQDANFKISAQEYGVKYLVAVDDPPLPPAPIEYTLKLQYDTEDLIDFQNIPASQFTGFEFIDVDINEYRQYTITMYANEEVYTSIWKYVDSNLYCKTSTTVLSFFNFVAKLYVKYRYSEIQIDTLITLLSVKEPYSAPVSFYQLNTNTGMLVGVTPPPTVTFTILPDISLLASGVTFLDIVTPCGWSSLVYETSIDCSGFDTAPPDTRRDCIFDLESGDTVVDEEDAPLEDCTTLLFNDFFNVGAC